MCEQFRNRGTKVIGGRWEGGVVMTLNLSVAWPCTPKRRIILENKTKVHVVWATKKNTVHNAQPDGEELPTAGDVVLEAASNMRFSTESTASQSAPVRFTTNLLMCRLMRRRRAKHAFLVNRSDTVLLSLRRFISVNIISVPIIGKTVLRLSLWEWNLG